MEIRGRISRVLHTNHKTNPLKIFITLCKTVFICFRMMIQQRIIKVKISVNGQSIIGCFGWHTPPYSHTPSTYIHIHTHTHTQKRVRVILTEIFLCCYCLVAKLYPTLWESMDCNQPGSSVHGISQARILAWVAISFSRGSSQLRDRTQVSYIGRETNLISYIRFFPTEPLGRPPNICICTNKNA